MTSEIKNIYCGIISELLDECESELGDLIATKIQNGKQPLESIASDVLKDLKFNEKKLIEIAEKTNSELNWVDFLCEFTDEIKEVLKYWIVGILKQKGEEKIMMVGREDAEMMIEGLLQCFDVVNLNESESLSLISPLSYFASK